MIRNVTPQDACAIVDIYNHYITLSTATFEITSLDEAEMRQRILAITSHYPYFVEETDGKSQGIAMRIRGKNGRPMHRHGKLRFMSLQAKSGKALAHA